MMLMFQAAPVRRSLQVAAVLCLALNAPVPAAAEWATRETNGRLEAGTSVDGALAGLLLRCPAPGRMELVLTHNGAVFDRDLDHTIVISVDGTATLLTARAAQGERAGDDDFVYSGTTVDLDPLLVALARGRIVEISAPSGRYSLPLAGSSRAISAFRDGCGSR